MPTTYTADKAASTYPARAGIGLNSQWSSYTVAANLAASDVFEMFRVPSGATILHVCLSSSDLDDGTQLVYDVGDGSDVDRFIDGSTIGQAGGVTVGFLSSHINGHLYQYSAEDTMDILVATAPQTPVAEGTIELSAIYSLQN
jgi:hypothetical protein